MEIKEKNGLRKIIIPVEGMTCASCVARVEKAIGKVEGVKNVSVNLATEKAAVELEDKTDIKEIIKRVENAGYKIDSTLLKKSNNDDKESEFPGKANLEKIRKDFVIALILTVPITIMNMGMMLPDFHRYIPLTMDYINKILLILTTPVIFISGKRFFIVFWNNLKHFTADMNSLVAVGTGSAYAYSAFITLFPGFLLPSGEESHVYYDTAAMIITLILMGRWLESRAKVKTNSALKNLIELKPKTALVKRNEIQTEVLLEELQLGDIVVVKPGERIPADGIIINGSSFIDESMVTGESIPMEKGPGLKVIGGTINGTGSFDYTVTALGDNSVLGKIIKMVEEAQGSKAPIQSLADKTAAVFVPAVISIALITFAGWLIISGNFDKSLINFVAVLIIACPCALGLATPTAIMVAAGKGAGLGILIKNGESLELAHKIRTLIFDKTGTLTEGKYSVTKILAKDIEEEKLLRIAASLESKSEHPLARAVVNYAKTKNITLIEPESFISTTGFGIEGNIKGDKIVIGNYKYLINNSIVFNGFEEKSGGLFKNESSVIYVGINGSVKGIIFLEDIVKDSSISSVKKLKEMKIKTVMLTGDNKKTAELIAEKTGVDYFEAEVLPQDKAEMVKKYQKENEIVAMVGDGINDAPALAQSNLGIALAGGTDAASEAASIVLMKDNPADIVSAIQLSKKTIRIIKQNLFWAFIYNVIGIPLAALGMLNPVFAALAMSFSSVSVVSNSLRLKNFRPR
ncbi:MAG TPA: heavy metal translocating P-type ATPase [Ignavibacteriaceae bacterium]|nr:heavy metal translocating P-type ATPase [Ignavibacteriaceae bacterium]